MPHPANRDEERALLNETVLRPDAAGGDVLPLIRLKAVYLGGNLKKTDRLKGQVIEIRDPDHPDDPSKGFKEQSSLGFTMYDFAVLDERGRKIASRLGPDGRPFQWVSHLEHLRYFFLKRGLDKERMYEIRGAEKDVKTFQDWLKARRTRRQDSDSGTGALKKMGFTSEDTT